MGERLQGQTATRRARQHAIAAQLVEHDGVVGGVDHDAHVRVVLGRGAQQRDTADVDRLDARALAERVEVADHEVDGRDALGLEVGHVRGLVAVGQDPSVNGRV